MTDDTKYKHNKTRIDINIDDANIILATNYADTFSMESNDVMLNLIRVFKTPEDYVLHIHDNRTNKDKNLSFEVAVNF